MGGSNAAVRATIRHWQDASNGTLDVLDDLPSRTCSNDAATGASEAARLATCWCTRSPASVPIYLAERFAAAVASVPARPASAVEPA